MSKGRKMRLASVMAVLIGCVAVPDAEAHDYWLAQEPAVLGVGDTCAIRLWVGDRLEPEAERPLQSEITTRYEWWTATGSIDLLEHVADGATPVFQRTVNQPRTGLLVMDRDFVTIDSDYERFADFLAHEEADELSRRIRDIPAGTEMQRRYARNLKALVRVGAGDDAGLHGRRVGQRLEIVLLDDPWALDRNAPLGVQVFFEGSPLAGEWVRRFVGHGDGAVAVSKARTDAEGRVTFPVDQAGLWVLRVGYVRPCADCEETMWDTFYATYSLQVPAVEARRGEAPAR